MPPAAMEVRTWTMGGTGSWSYETRFMRQTSSGTSWPPTSATMVAKDR